MKNVIEYLKESGKIFEPRFAYILVEASCPSDVEEDWGKLQFKDDDCDSEYHSICTECWANVDKKLMEEKYEKPLDLQEVKREKAREKLIGQLKRKGLMEDSDE